MSRSLPALLAGALFVLASRLACAGSGALLSYADGEIQLIRGETAQSVRAGVTLANGDILQTAANRSAQVEFGSALAVAISPDARVLLRKTEISAQAAASVHLTVLSGWVKVQTLDPAGVVATTLETPSMRIAMSGGSGVLHAASDRSEFFAESLSPKVSAISSAGRAAEDLTMAREQQAVKLGSQPLRVLPRPTQDFLAGIPVTMRDPLFALAAKVKPQLATRFPSHPVTYAEVETWLDAGPQVRVALMPRFRPRIHDAGFRAELDRGLDRHPEWRDILHPPVPPAMPGADPAATTTTSHPAHEGGQ